MVPPEQAGTAVSYNLVLKVYLFLSLSSVVCFSCKSWGCPVIITVLLALRDLSHSNQVTPAEAHTALLPLAQTWRILSAYVPSFIMHAHMTSLVLECNCLLDSVKKLKAAKAVSINHWWDDWLSTRWRIEPGNKCWCEVDARGFVCWLLYMTTIPQLSPLSTLLLQLLPWWSLLYLCFLLEMECCYFCHIVQSNM